MITRYRLPCTGLWLLLCLAGSVHATEASRPGLLEAYDAAARNDARLSAVRHEYEGQAEATAQARAGLLPNLSMGVRSETTTLSRDTPGLSRQRSGTTFQANLSQPLIHLDRWYQLRAAQFSVAQAELSLAAKEQELVLTTTRAYVDVLRAQDLVAASRAEEAALRQQRDQAQGRLDDGAASITDLYDAQAAYDNAAANREQAERKVDDAFEALARLTGTRYQAVAGIGHGLPMLAPLPEDPSAWANQAGQQNLELLASGEAVSAAEQQVSQRKAGHAPTLDVVASYRKGDNDSFGYSNPTDFGVDGYRGNVAQGSLGLELNIPLYSGGAISSEVREATAQFQQRQDEHEDKRRTVLVEVRNSYRAVTSDLRLVSARRQSIRSGLKSVEANEVGARIGTRNISDVLNAQRQLYAAVREYNNARYDYIVDSLTLKCAAGSLQAHDLAALAAYQLDDYDPDRDYLPPR